MEIFYKLLSIAFSLLILYNAIYIKKVVGTWLFPACLFSLFWFCYTFFPLLVMFEVPINPISIGFITISVIFFSWTFVFFNWKKAFKENLNKPNVQEVFNTSFLRGILIFSIIISIIFSVQFVIKQGFSLNDMITNTVLVAEKFAMLRYADKLQPTFFGPLSLMFCYISVLVGGVLFGATTNKRKKRIILLCFFPALIVMLTQSAKGLFFGSIFYFLGGILVTSIFQNKFLLLKSKNIAIVSKLAFVSVILISLSFLSRGLRGVTETTIILEKLRFLFASYFFGHLYNFSDWLDSYLGIRNKMNFDTSNYHLGYYTFTGIFKFFGSKKETPTGTFSEFNNHSDVMVSNIYTIFRGFIMDFGIIGAVFFIIINGFFIHLMYYIFLKQKRPVFASSILIFMLVYFYISFGVSLMTWNIILIVFFLLFVILLINNYKFVYKKID